MRIREPLNLVQKDLTDIAQRIDAPSSSPDLLKAELQVEVNRLKQIVENLFDIQRAVAEEREDIPESYKAFIKRQ